jgi:release factor glutamine methyltransferase
MGIYRIDPTAGCHDYAVIAVRDAIADATVKLSASGIGSASVDAELLAAHVLGVPRSRLVLVRGLNAQAHARFADLVRQRAGRKPLQHLTGSAPFRDVELAVGPGVFIPRPETEELVSWGLARLTGPAPLVVDLCAGSGAIAVSVADEHPGAVVLAVENSAAALPWLRRNVDGTAIRVVEGDVTSARTLAGSDGTVDLVLCNPPYVPAGTPVEPEVGVHDPYNAVFSGADGLDVIRPVIHRAAALLRPGGFLGIEHDDTHGTAVPELLAATGAYDSIEDHRDLAGRPRFATARRLAHS